MKAILESIAVCSDEKQQMINLTDRINTWIAASGVQNGFVGLFSQHTTAVLLVNEWQDALLEDVGNFLGHVVSDDRSYKHNLPQFSDCERGNAASHLRSLLFNNSVLLPVCDGRPVLGRFQSVIMAELDGPRERTVKIQLFGE